MALVAVVEISSGRLHTIAEDPGTLPPGFTAHPLLRKPDFETHEWNGTNFVPRPLPVVGDRMADILDDAELPALNAAARTRLTTVLQRHFNKVDPGWRTYTK